MPEYLDYLIIALGLMATAYPLFGVIKFKGTTRLGDAVAFMFAGESFGMIVVVAFSIMAALDVAIHDDHWIKPLMRCSMFIVAIITSTHLRKVVNSLSELKNNANQ